MKLALFCIFGILLFPFCGGFALAEIVEFEFKGEFYSCERSSPEESVILVRGRDTVFRPESLLKKFKRKRARVRRTLRSSTSGQKRVQRLRNESQELKKFIGFIKECQLGSLFDEPPTPTPTPSPTGSPSPTATPTPEPSPTVTPSPSPSPTPLPANTVVVSPTGSYQTLAQAHQAVQDGWTILVESGTYLGQAALATITKDNLTIRGIGDRPVFDPEGLSAEGKAIWVIKGENTTIENIEFTGATVIDRNGAGIRFEGEDLTIIGCHFHHNEMGILSKSTGGGRIEITSSEFHHNGYGDGFSHNIYINRAAEFWLTFSSTHHAIIGHNVKSRAEKNYILYNRIMEEGDGNSSYSVDLPNGGLSYLIGNLIQQSPVAQNGNIISYGAEGLVWGNNTLYASHNTIVNDRQSGGTFFRIFNGTARASNNLLIGNGTINSGGTFVNTNNLLTTAAILVDRANYNYALASSAALAINQGIASGSGDGFPLTPTFEYLHPLGGQIRLSHGQIDIGALEYRP